MKRHATTTIATMALLAAALATVPAAAQGVAYPNEASRQLGECIALSTSGKDRVLTARWFAASLGSAPQVADAVTVDPAAKVEADREMAALFTRLFTQDCAKEAAPLMNSGDMAGIQAAGGRLGQIAMQELMSDPQVLQAMMSYIVYIDQSAFDKLGE